MRFLFEAGAALMMAGLVIMAFGILVLMYVFFREWRELKRRVAQNEEAIKDLQSKVTT